MESIAIELLPNEITKFRELKVKSETFYAIHKAGIKAGDSEKASEYYKKYYEIEVAMSDFIYDEILPRAHSELNKKKYPSLYSSMFDGRAIVFDFESEHGHDF